MAELKDSEYTVVDFSHCKTVEGICFADDNSAKLCVTYQDDLYMLKFPKELWRDNDEPFSVQQCFTEHLACQIFRRSGLAVQDTVLGTYTIKKEKVPVVACKVFTSPSRTLVDFAQIFGLDSQDEDFDESHELPKFTAWMDCQQYVEPLLLKDYFWQMFVLDAYLGNCDRNFTNMGFLKNTDTGTHSLAPVFDCGDSFDVGCRDEFVQAFAAEPEQYDDYIFGWPMPIFRIGGKRLRYYDYLMHGGNNDCSKALKKIVPTLDEKAIFAAIDAVPMLAESRKKFFKTLLHRRMELIILPAYLQAGG